MLSLIMTVIMVFLLTCTEGVHMYLGKGRATQCVVSAGESVLADYNSFLWEKYHILAVDQSYVTKNAKAISYKWQEYFMDNLCPLQRGEGVSFYTFFLERAEVMPNLYLTEGEGRVLMEEIRQYMKYQVGKEALEEIVDIAMITSNEEAVSEAKEKVEESDKKAKEAELEENIKAKEEMQKTVPEENNDININEKKTEENRDGEDKGLKEESHEETKEADEEIKENNKEIEDPRDTLKDLLDFGVVELITGKSDISKEERINTIKLEKSDEAGNTKENEEETAKETAQEDEEEATQENASLFQESDEITSRLTMEENYEKNSLSNAVITEGLVLHYILTTFSNCVSGEECETEYIIAGKDSDYDNVKSVINRLIGIRFPVAFTYAITDTALNKEALALATSIAGATANPALVEVVKYLLLACISYVEALLDVRTLYQGGKVEFLKNKGNWKMNFTSIGKFRQISSDSEEKGMSYQDYLRLLLLMQIDKNVKYERMLTVMDINGKKDNPQFDIFNMVYEFHISAQVTLAPKFVNIMSPISMDSKNGYEMEFEKYMSY